MATYVGMRSLEPLYRAAEPCHGRRFDEVGRPELLLAGAGRLARDGDRELRQRLVQRRDLAFDVESVAELGLQVLPTGGGDRRGAVRGERRRRRAERSHGPNTELDPAAHSLEACEELLLALPEHLAERFIVLELGPEAHRQHGALGHDPLDHALVHPERIERGIGRWMGVPAHDGRGSARLR
jgi:hypothetical protein